MSSLQAAYRANHSTETVVLRVLTDILQALDSGAFAALTLLAFFTVDHTALLRRLEVTYGVCGSALSWFASYLSDRTQYVCSVSTTLPPTRVRYGVPHGLVFGPILFLLFTTDLTRLVERLG
jgi:Reverse transcriptase (RNA-dependent DNA polymerase)